MVQYSQLITPKDYSALRACIHGILCQVRGLSRTLFFSLCIFHDVKGATFDNRYFSDVASYARSCGPTVLAHECHKPCGLCP